LRRSAHDGRAAASDDVSGEADLEEAAAREAGGLGGERRHLADRLFESEDFLVAHVLTQNAREVAVSARMGVGFQKNALWRLRGFIRTE